MKFYRLVPASTHDLQWIISLSLSSCFPESITVAQRDWKNEQLAGSWNSPEEPRCQPDRTKME